MTPGQRVMLHRPGQPEDGWFGWVEAVTPDDVMVRLDQPLPAAGRLVSLPHAQVRPAPPETPAA